MTRREALVAGSALLGAAVWAGHGSAVEPTREDPFHDPTYSVMHSRAELIKPLKPHALKAQETPRSVNGLHVTGLPESLPGLDDKVTRLMKASGIPGVAMSIAHNKRLVCTRGYGKASRAGNVPVEPTTPGGLMSDSKPLTVHAALMLIRDQKLNMHDLAFKILKDSPLLAPGQSVDPRIHQIKVEHLMNHTSGLFNVVEDLNDPPRFAEMAHKGQIKLVHDRINQNDLVRVGMREPLLFEPGAKFAYSGQGMQVLARIVEKVSGLRLDHFIQQHIFAPLGIRSYYVGSYLADDQYAPLMRSDRKSVYALCPSVYDESQNRHAARDISNWGYVSWGQADACGWAALHNVDLLRWITFLPNLIGPPLLKALTHRPTIVNDAGQREKSGMGLGWGVYEWDVNGTQVPGIQHFGAWPGERCYAEYRPDGGSYTVQFNSDRQQVVDEIIDAARKFLDGFDAAGHRFLDWADYGYGAPRTGA